MITPESIQQKAGNQYPAFLRSWLAGESFFPFVIRSSKSLESGAASDAIAAIGRLRDQSKAVVGRGYTVEWEERRSRVFGRNNFPQRITVETEADFLWLAGKTAEFAAFSHSVQVIRRLLPELESWIVTHAAKLAEIREQVEGLCEVVRYFKQNPNPGMFARELPLPVPTKFMEWNQGVLREWLDLALPAHAINAAESRFERRYGLRHAEQHILLRFLDDLVRDELKIAWSELSLPISAIAGLEASNLRVFIVENRVNALTLPAMSRSIVLGGLGDAVVLLQTIPWLASSEVFYWGDLDSEGFEALSSLRGFLPKVRSLLMDFEDLEALRQNNSGGSGKRSPKVLLLSAPENAAYNECCLSNLRIEQERVIQPMVLSKLRLLGLL